jgi:arylsulfatase A-like enzyme
VILITLDTTRADHLWPWGGEQALTPGISSLASDAIVFLDATSPAPTTLAAHASIMTGRSPRSHGAARNGFSVHSENEMLAELLGAAGFQTIAVVGSFALDSLFGLDQGFARYDEEFGLEFLPGLYDQNQRRADQVTLRALELVDGALGADEDARVFLFAHYFDPHAPYDPPDWALERVGLEAGSRADLIDLGQAVLDQQHAAAGVRLGQRWVFTNGLSPEMLDGASGSPSKRGERLAKLYRAELAFMDREIGRLVDGLAERGMLEDCLIIVTADHGETFWEHGDFWNHGLAVYQTTVRVPLLWRLPGRMHAGEVVEAPVSTLDVLPTVCGLLGIDVPAEVEGVDLSPAWEGVGLPRRVLVSEATQPVGVVELEGEWRNSAKAKAAREGRWKYILTPYLGNREELYDLAADPGERVNLLQGAGPDVLEKGAELRGALEEWAGRTLPLPSAFDSAQADEIRERLKALGYSGKGD